MEKTGTKKITPSRRAGAKPASKAGTTSVVTFPPEHSKSKLLNAALTQFSEHGFHGTTTKMISQAAGVNEALIIRHFATKEGLFLKVIEQNYVQDFGSLNYPPQKTLLGELTKFSQQVIETQLRNSTFARMFFAHALQNPDFAESMRSGLEGVCGPLLGARLKNLAKQGKLLSSVDPRFVEDTIFRLSFSATFFSALLGFENVSVSKARVCKEIQLLVKALTPVKRGT